MFFLGATDTPVLDPLGFKARVGSALFPFCGGKYNVHSPRSTSGATLTDLLAAGLQLVLSPHTVCRGGGYRDSNSQNICESDALPSELNRDRLQVILIGSGFKIISLRQSLVNI